MNDRRLVPADETLNHQIVDTFASVGQSDLSWTEKIWMAVHPTDGSFGVTMGVGKYTNRGVFDGFGAVSRGVEQWTVRASRRLAPHPDVMASGPISYEIIDPLYAVRAVLEPTDRSPIPFDVTMESEVPPAVEDHWPQRSPDGYRLHHDVLRYHAGGTAHGWVQLDGERIEIPVGGGWAFRDHSWGVRPEIGGPLPGLAPAMNPTLLEETAGRDSFGHIGCYCNLYLERAGGGAYAIEIMHIESRSPAGRTLKSWGAELLPSGDQRPFASIAPAFRVDPRNGRFLGGVVDVTTADGTERPITLTVVSDSGTGCHLGPGNYFGYKGQWHGEWRGELDVEADYIPDCSLPDVVKEIHSVRDVLVRVDDPVGGGSGYGNIEGGASGVFADNGDGAASAT